MRKLKKNSKVSVIIFTYKRAIILNEVLKSLYKNFVNLEHPIYVIYHFDERHENSYTLLKNRWKSKNIIFIKRGKTSYFKIVKYLFLNPLNFLWILRWPILLKNFNDFKFILEDLLKNKIKSKFVTMVPDDQIFFSKTLVPDKALKFLMLSKKNYFYRFFSSKFFKGYNSLPVNLKTNNYNSQNVKFFEWSCSDPQIKNKYLWKYRFTIEGTVFRRKTLYNLIKPFLYHNPITLEAIGLWEARFRGYFNNGFSSFKRTAAGYQVNSVQNLVYHKNKNFSENKLQKLFLKGFSLSINKKDFKEEMFDVVPKELYLKKRNKKYNFQFIK